MIIQTIELTEWLTLATLQAKIDEGDFDYSLDNHSFITHVEEGVVFVDKNTRVARIIAGSLPGLQGEKGDKGDKGDPGEPGGSGNGTDAGAGFETTHQNSANTMNNQPSFGNDAGKILIRAIPSVKANIVSLSFMNGQSSEKDVRLGIFNSQRQLLKQTGTVSLNTLGYITLDLESPQNVEANEIYYLGISMSSKNNNTHIIGNNINVLSGTGNIPGQAFRATEASTSNWNGIEQNKMEGQMFVPWIKANAG